MATSTSTFHQQDADDNYTVWIKRNVGNLKLADVLNHQNFEKKVKDYSVHEDWSTLISCTVARFADGTAQWFKIPSNVIDKDTLDLSDDKQLSDISELYAGWNILSIGEALFSESLPSLKTVYMPYVQHIGPSAFMYQTSLSSAIGPNVLSIGEYAFQGCSSLTAIAFENCTTIGDRTFFGCNSIERAYLPALTSVPFGALYMAAAGDESDLSIGAKHIDIRSASYIGYAGIANNMRCTELCCQSVMSCDVFAFAATYPPEITLTALTAIADNDGMFNYTVSYMWIDKINLPNVTSIGRHGMRDCLATEVVCPKLESMPNGGMMFDYSDDPLSSVTTNSLTSLGKYSFYKRTGLKHLDLASCTAISGLALYGAGVQYVYAPELTSLDEMCEGTLVNAGQFRTTSSLRAVSMPKLQYFGSHCFDKCTGLQYASFPSALSIGSRAFANCTSLRVIDFGNTMPEVPLLFDSQKLWDSGEVAKSNVQAFEKAGESAGALSVVVPDSLVASFMSDSAWQQVANQTTAAVSFVGHTAFMAEHGNAVQALKSACMFAGAQDYMALADAVADAANASFA